MQHILKEADKIAMEKWNSIDSGITELHGDDLMGNTMDAAKVVKYPNGANISGNYVVFGHKASSGNLKAVTQYNNLEEQLIKLEIKSVDLEHEIKVLSQYIHKLDITLQEVVDEIHGRPIITPGNIFDIGSKKFCLHLPIPIVIEEYKQEVIARIPDLEIHGFGNTEPEAISELKSHLLELYSDLESTPKENLGELPTRWWSLLTKLVERREQK